MSTTPSEPKTNTPPPIEYAGQWIAWSQDRSQILAHAKTFKELWRIVEERGLDDPIFSKVPRADWRYVGCT